MADTAYPLLVFPEPAHSERVKRDSFPSRVNTPDVASQAQRLIPQFERLQQAMERQRLELQAHTQGIQPERVLVLETIGSVDDFIKAVNRIPGLDWLGEFDVDDIAPDHGFEDARDPEMPLRGRLYLVLTDQQALEQLRSLFERWRRDSTEKFPTGLTPIKRVFSYLYAVRPWSAEDRARETGILEDWRDRLLDGEESVPFEAELWFRSDPARRETAEAELQSVIELTGGEVVQQCLIQEIGYHAVLGRMPRTHLQGIGDNLDEFQEIRLLRCEGVRHVRPVGQCAIRLGADETEPLADEDLSRIMSPPSLRGDPVVALLDGLPLAGHRLLDRRVIVDDPDGYESAYQAHERSHGTAMASLICHDDLNQRPGSAERPLYARPILQPRRGFHDQFEEAIPEDVLPVDLIHRAVRRLFEGENGEPPAAPTVRIVNLSVGDKSRLFVREMSPWARVLDWLAWRHRILFIVSAGNHSHDIELTTPRRNLESLSPEQREEAILRALARDTWQRSLLSPAETLNGVTVGAIHDDASSLPRGPHPSRGPFDPFSKRGLPSVVSAHGPGYRRAIKPDVFLAGGRQLVVEKLGTAHDNAIVQIRGSTSLPGQRVAVPGMAGQLDRTCYTSGTSNAAALASRAAGSLLSLLEELRNQPGNHLPPEYDTVLTKTLLVHSADGTVARRRYEDILKTADNGRTFREYVGRFLGYGSVQLNKVLTCTEERVTALGFGELNDGSADEFGFPLPPSLRASTDRRRLTVTLAWLSPTSFTRRGYRVAQLWFDPKNPLAPDRVLSDHRAVQRGTVQHEMLEGDKATVFEDGDTIKIKVSCRADAGDISSPIPYGLAVTLEAMEGAQLRLTALPIYEEVRVRLATRIRVQGQPSFSGG